MEKEIEINALVWAKIVGFPPWPSLVVQPEPNMPDKPLSKYDLKYYWVYFFGSHNYAWVEKRHLKPYADSKKKYSSSCKTILFKEAIAEIDAVFMEIRNNPNYEVPVKPFKEKENTSRKRKRSTTSSANKKLKPTSIDIDENSTGTELYVTSAKAKRNQTKSKDITSPLTFGVLGISIIGRCVIETLVRLGHNVNIWNRTSQKFQEFQTSLHFNGSSYIKTYINPRKVMELSDIVFNCVSDHNVSKEMIQNYFGINNLSDNILNKKGFVQMTSIDPETSKYISDMIEKKGGRYLEAQVQGSQLEAIEGSLVLLTAGNKSLYFDCQSCFKSMGKSVIFLGDVGYATKMNLILQLIKGVCLAGLAEGIAVAKRYKLPLIDFQDIFDLTNIASSYLRGKSKLILEENISCVEESLQNMQKDMNLALELSNRIGQSMELASAANEIFKHCCSVDLDDYDASCIYMRPQF